MFCPVIVALALWISLGVALFATIVSAFVATYFFLPPAHSLSISNPRDIIGLLLFVMVGAAISGIGDQFRRRSHRLQEFEKAIEGVQEMILVIDRDYRYLIANATFCVTSDGSRKIFWDTWYPKWWEPKCFSLL